MPQRSDAASDKLRRTLELFDLGVGLMRQNLTRSHPGATEQEIDALLREWLHERPGAEFGDCPGRAVDVPRRR
jgi:hypothetical protein